MLANLLKQHEEMLANFQKAAGMQPVGNARHVFKNLWKCSPFFKNRKMLAYFTPPRGAPTRPTPTHYKSIPRRLTEP